MRVLLKPGKPLESPAWRVPPDKSISHRSIMMGALGDGLSVVHNFLQSQDCLSTVRCIRGLGVQVEERGDTVRVQGRGPKGLREPQDVLDAGNSGTTMRLLCGLLSGLPFFSVMTGDGSLRSRPMARVVTPLRKMGAEIWGRNEGQHAPLAVRGGHLKGIRYDMPVASAQLKSCLLLAGFLADGTTAVREPARSRDHTERMLTGRGVKVNHEAEGWISIEGGQSLAAVETKVPGDPSSAAFLGACGLLVPDSHVVLHEVLVNPTRMGFFNILRRMGADIEEADKNVEDGEPIADLVFDTSELHGVQVTADEVPSAIDELPLLAVLATQAVGETVVSGAEELRVKESDRIAGVVAGLGAMGARIEELRDGYRVVGPTPLRGAFVDSRHDHRLAMAFGVAAQIATGETVIEGAESVDISFPGFWSYLGADSV